MLKTGSQTSFPVQVRIGRIEVRVPEPATAVERPATRRGGFEDYAAMRSYDYGDG